MAKEHGDMSEFESRHSEPRDPISGPSLGGPEGSRFRGKEDGNSDQSVPVDPDLISYSRYAPGMSPRAGRGRVLSFAGVGAHPLSTSHKRSETGEGIYQRGRERERAMTDRKSEQLDGAELVILPGFQCPLCLKHLSWQVF